VVIYVKEFPNLAGGHGCPPLDGFGGREAPELLEEARVRLVGQVASVLVTHTNGGKAGTVPDPGLGAEVAEVLAPERPGESIPTPPSLAVPEAVEKIRQVVPRPQNLFIRINDQLRELTPQGQPDPVQPPFGVIESTSVVDQPIRRSFVANTKEPSTQNRAVGTARDAALGYEHTHAGANKTPYQHLLICGCDFVTRPDPGS
jgi:hypothetical protein